jgi:hypothetical protein
MASKNQSIKVGPLRERELEEADRIVRVVFGTFLGLPNPLEFMGDHDFITPRWRSPNTAVLAGWALPCIVRMAEAISGREHISWVTGGECPRHGQRPDGSLTLNPVTEEGNESQFPAFRIRALRHSLRNPAASGRRCYAAAAIAGREQDTPSRVCIGASR